jgi:hypothetical protein
MAFQSYAICKPILNKESRKAGKWGRDVCGFIANPYLQFFGSRFRFESLDHLAMEYRKQSNGLQTFLEYGWFASIAVVAIVATWVLDFFTELSGTPWICFFVASFALLVFGGGLIGYAKFPVYRSGRFFTFGIKSVPWHLAGYYRWGWRVFLFGVALSLCLLLPRP